MAESCRRSFPWAEDDRQRRRTALLVVLSLLAGLLATPLVLPTRPADAAVSVTQVGHWALDAGTGTTAVDSAGSKPATLGAGATWTPGIRGASALALNGSSTGNAATSGPVLTTSSSFSVSAYVKLNNLNGFQTIASQDGNVNSGFYLQLQDSDRFSFNMEGTDASGSTSVSAVSSANAVVGRWYHLVGVYNSVAGTSALYVNGRLQSTMTKSANFATTGNFVMGRAKYNSGAVDFVNGTIDDVRAYSGALTAADVEQIANAAYWKFDESSGTTATDEGLNANSATLSGDASRTGGPYSSAVDLDGSGDAVTAAGSVVDTAKSFSVTTWARADSVTAVGTVASVDGTNRSAFELRMGSDAKWAFTRPATDTAGATSSTIASTATTTAGRWYHLAAVYDSVAGTLNLYVDGTRQGTGVAYTGGWKGTGSFVLGRARSAGAAAGYLDGAVDETHVYPFLLEDATVTSLAARTAPPRPATPTATTTGSSVTLSWVDSSIASNPNTGYVVTPYVNGTAQAPQTFNTTATSQTFTGLTLGSSYRYTVAATNSIGTSPASAQSTAVVPATAPATPSAPTATAGSLSATVSWTAPSSNGSAISSYTVTPYVGTTAQTPWTYFSTATSQVVTGLTAGTAYTFRVTAANAVGSSAQSAASNAVTPNPGPSITSGAPPAATTGTAYSFTFTRSGGTTPFTWSVTAGTLPPGLSLSSAGVLSGTPTTAGSYPVTVRVVDASGESASSSVTVVVTGAPATPAAPTATAGLTSAVVSWVAPASNGATITAYVITPYRAGVAQTPITVDPSAKTRTLTGLTAGSVYTFTVAATNSVGTSAASPASNPVTPYAALNEPTITSVSAGSTSARLTWTAPSSTGNSAITGYVVTPYVGGVAQPPQTFTGTATTRTVTGLTAGTAYTFRVAATNNSGVSWLYRNSVGGPQLASVDEGPVWAADTTGATRSNFENTSTWNVPVVVDGTVPAGTPSEVFLTQRWDPGAAGDGAEGSLSYPVTAGTPVKVRLYFHNGNTGTVAGQRVFDVALEGSTVLPSFDVVTAAGGNQRGTMREFTVTSDGAINLNFAHNPADPILNGVEIIRTGTATTGPQSASSAAVTPNASPSLTFADPPSGRVGVAYSHQLTVNGGTSPYAWSVLSGGLPAGITLGASTGLLSGTPTASGSYAFTVQATDDSGQTATRAVTLVVTAPPATPAAPTATAGLTSAVVSWTAPSANSATITAYVITPYRAGVAQTPITVDPSAKTRTLTGLTAGSVYTFTVAATNSVGTSAASPASNPVTPYAALNEPTITSVSASSTSARLTWTAPTSTGNSAITGYVVTPYVGGVAQPPQTFTGTATTRTVTGLTAGTAYTFRVAATNNSGSTVLYRIDAGGPGAAALDGGPAWAADNTADNPLRTSGSNTADFGSIDGVDSTVPSSTPSSVLNTERWDPGEAPDMQWSFPVTTGASTTVRLYFANGASHTASTGQRVFDVALEGTTVLPAFDIIPAAGGARLGTMREFTVPSDGTVNVNFSNTVDAAIVNAIELLQTGTATTGPQSASSAAVTPNASPSLSFAAPPSASVNVAYSHQLTVDGGTAPFAWSVASGTLPAGITLSASGLLSGTPTAAGTYAFTVQVTDDSGQTATRSVSLVVAAAPVVTFAPAAGEVGVAYSQQPTVTGGTGPFTWSLTAGSLPSGLTLNSSTGLISGTPTASGTYSITLRAVDSRSQAATRTASVVIAAQPTLTSTPPSGRFGVQYSFTFAATGGTAPFSYELVSGSWPTGLSLSSAGVLSGNPLQTGSFAYTVRVTDGFGQTATRSGTLVIDVASVQVTRSTSVSSVAPGGEVTYTITAANVSSTTYNGVELTEPLADVLDDATYSGGASASSGTVSSTGSAFVWAVDLPAGTTRTLTYTVTVNSPAAGNEVLASKIRSSFVSSNCFPDSTDPACTSSVTVSGLEIVKTASAATTTPGSTVTFTVVVTNTGQTPFSGATFSDPLAAPNVLDDATYPGGASATSGTISYASSTLSWTGNLAVGASATITYAVTVLDPDPGNRVLSSRITSATPGSTCPTGGTAAGCIAAVTVLVPALSISTTANVSTTTPGSTVTYTMTLSNTGQTAYAGSTTAGLALAGALDDGTYAGSTTSAGSVAFNAGTGLLTWTGSLAVGASVTVTASVAVSDPDPGNKSMVAVAGSSAAGSSCPPGSGNAGCTATVTVLVPALTLAATADATTTPGGTVTHTVTATNSGQTAYTGATFTVDLTGVLDDAGYNFDALASGGTVTYSAPNLTWTGNLALGATVTLTYTVTVQDPDPGDRSLVSSVRSAAAGSSCPIGTTDPDCTATVAVLLPGLQITTSADVASTTPGSVVRYNQTVQNTGETAYADLEVVLDFADVADDATLNFDGQISRGTIAPRTSGVGLVWTLTLAPGETATATATFNVKSPATGNRSMGHFVTADAEGSSCVTGAEGGCTSTVAVLLPELTLTKTADVTTAQPGEQVTYTVEVENTGETSYPAASFTDPLAQVLDDATYAGGATATTGTVSYSAPTLTWTGALAPGQSATVTYVVTIRSPDPGDKVLTNTVTSTTEGATCRAGSTPAPCSSRVDVLVPGLTLVTTASGATTTPGAVVTFTVTVTNSGATAYTGAAFSESLAGILDDATYNSGSVGASTGTAGYADSTITWSGNLAVGASATITYAVTVRAADVGDDLLAGTVTSTTAGATCPAGGADTRCTVVVPVARLIIQEAAQSPTTTPGTVLDLYVTFTNTGQVPYTGISIRSPGADVLDDVISGGNQAASSGSLSVTPGAIVWTGSIPVGGVVTVSGTATVKNAADLGNRLIVTPWISEAPGNNCPTGSTDTRCRNVIQVLVPELTITKTADVTSVVAGGSVAYTVTVDNTGETPYDDATVTDSLTGVLDDAVFNADALATSGSMSYAAPLLTWTGDLAVGTSASFTYSVTTADPGTGNHNLLNRVSSAAAGSSCPVGTTSEACQSELDVQVPRLVIAKTADVVAATLGSTVTYTVEVINAGQTSYPSASFSDDLTDVVDDAPYDVGSATATRGTVGYAAGVLSWSGALTPGQTAVVSYTVTVANPATGNGSLVNLVSSTAAGNDCAAGSTDARCSVTIPVVNATSLTLTKTADVVSAAAGEEVEFTVEVLNSTGSTISDAELTDPLADVLDDADYNADAAASSGTVGFDGSAVTWTGSVGPGDTVTVTYSVTVEDAGAGNELLVGQVSSPSEPGSNNCAAASNDARCTVSVGVARLELSQSADRATATPGSLIVVTVLVTNTGQVPYTDVSVASPRADTSDDTVPLGDQVATSGAIIRTADAVVWSGDVPVGQTVTITRTLRVRDPNPGNGLVRATLSSAAPGNNCPTGTADPACTFEVEVLTPELTLTKTVNSPAVPTGGVSTYTLLIANTGQTPYQDAVVLDSLIGLLDDGDYNLDAVASLGSVSWTSPTLTWTGDLAVGATATVTYTVTADDPGTGDKVMLSRISSADVGSSCPPGGSAPACQRVVIVQTPALTVSSTVDRATALPGDVVSYTLTVTNTGQTSYAPATVTAPLAGLLDDATYNADAVSDSGGTLTVTGSVLTWSGSLAPGADVVVTYSVTVDDPVSGNYLLQQTVGSANSGGNCATGTTDPRCTTSVAVASLLLVMDDGVDTVAPTDVVTYTSTLVNVGQVPYVGISASTSFVGALDDAAYNGDAAATSGSLIAVTGSGRITWTGDIGVGETVVVTGTLTVRNPDPADKVMTTRLSSAAGGTNCPTDSTDPRCVTSATVLTPELTLTKTADAPTTTPGSVVTYSVTVSNDGETAYEDASFTDDLTDVLSESEYLGATPPTVGSVTLDGSALTWTGDLAVGESTVVTYAVEVDDPVLGDGLMRNGVISDDLGSSCPTGNAVASCWATVAVRTPALDIDVTADRAATRPGQQVTYTITVQNTGEVDYDDAVVTSALAGVLDEAAYAGDAVASSGDVVFSSPNLVWTGDVAVGDTVTISYSVEVVDSGFADRLLQTSVSSPAAGSTCTVGSPCTNTLAVLLPGLAVTTTADATSATPGESVEFTVTITNTGEIAYVGAVVTASLADLLDDATRSGPFRVSRGTVGYAEPTLTWTGSLLIGQSATIRFDAVVDPPGSGDRAMTTTSSSAEEGSTCPALTADPACSASVSVLVPGLTLSTSADVAVATPGAVVTYTVLATNTGETAYQDAVVADSLADVLADADYNGDAEVLAGPAGVLDYAAPTLTWTGDLAVGAALTIRFSVTVHDPATGDHELVNAVTSAVAGSSCPPGGAPGAGCSSVVEVRVPGLALGLTADRTTVVAGDAVTYTVTLTNTGETAYAPAVFGLPLTDVLDDGEVTGVPVASAGTAVLNGQTLEWGGPLALGGTVTVTFTVTTDFPAPGDRTLAQTVSSDSYGAACAVGGCASTVAVLVPELSVTKVADATEMVAGGTVGYTISVTNTGEAPYAAAAVTDSLAGVLDDGTYGEDAAASSGTVAYASGVLTWEGPLAVGEAVTITYSIDVAAAGGGDFSLDNPVTSATRGSTCPDAGTDPACRSTVAVLEQTLTVADLADSFTLTGPAETTVSRDDVVGLTVTTNSAGGYAVTVQGGSAVLAGADPTNGDTIPLDRLRVRENGQGSWVPLSQSPLLVHSQNGPSAPLGDGVSNDYQVEIPFVNSDTYSTDLEYIVVTQ